MSSFDDREKGFENKFVHEQTSEFRAQARRNKLLGQWAAEEMGLSGAEADAYAADMVKADLEEPGDEDVFRKVRADFDAKGVGHSDHVIRTKMDQLMDEARIQLGR
ncbi:MAG: DUF1476 domain-containing protein [Oceanicaulis sp.]|nr:DUF1476 domain-containing protein [Oceanicaulis sp.]